MNNIKYPKGIDCVWLASDRDSHVAAFITAGQGPIPVPVLNQTGIRIEDIEQAVLMLPRTSGYEILVQVKRPDDFVALAERGLFVYDWQDLHRTTRESIRAYDPVARTFRPIRLRDLPEHLRSLAATAKLDDIAFADCSPLNVAGKPLLQWVAPLD